MGNKRWVQLETFLEVDGDKFDLDPAAETAAAIARGNIYCSPEVTEVPEGPVIDEDGFRLASQELVDEYAELAEDLEVQLRRVSEQLHDLHEPELLTDAHPSDCKTCGGLAEAEKTLAAYDQFTADLAARMDDFDEDDDQAWGPR